MYKKIIAPLIMTGIIGVSLTACSAENFDWVVKIDGKPIKPQTYLTSQLEAYIEAEFAAEDTKKSILSQQIEQMPAGDWIYERTVENLQKFCFVEDMFMQRGLTLSEAEQEYILAQAEQTWSHMGYLYESNGITYESYCEYVKYLFKYQLLFNDVYGDGGECEIDEKDIKKYINQNISNIQGFQIVKVNDDGTEISQEQLDILSNMANEACEKINKGQDLTQVAGEYMNLAGDMLGSNIDFSDASPYLVSAYITQESYGFEQEFINQCFEIVPNECAVYDMGDYFLVYQRLESYTSEEEFLYLKQAVLSILKNDEYEGYLREKYLDLKVDVNTKALKYYDPSKIKLKV